jgi:murein DD-endopeptidase MepM/ murein hydrolase activator NlpD
MALEDALDVTIKTLMFDGQTLHTDVTGSLKSADIKRTVDGAPTLTLGLHDPNEILVRSGLFAERITAQVDGKGFSLVKLTRSGSTLTVVFEDLAVAEMRKHTDPVKVEANTMTRADFARKLLDEDGSSWIKVYVAPGATMETTKVALARGVVPSSNTTSAQDPAYGAAGSSSAGAVSITDIARFAAKAGFKGNDLVIAVAVSKAEDGNSDPARVSPTNNNGTTDYGLWQINSVHKDLFNKYNWKDPLSNAQMAKAVWDSQGWKGWSTYNANKHLPFMAAAQAAVNDVTSLQDPTTGTPVGKLTASQRNKSLSEALLGTAEDTWTCIKRIFAEINWRVYVDWGSNNVAAIYVGPDSNFTNGKSEINVTNDSVGVDNIDYDFDLGKATATATITCRSHRWQLPPGTLVNLVTTGLPNPWLVSSIDRSLFSLQSTVSLKKPEPALPEPDASDAGTGVVDSAYGSGVQLAASDPAIGAPNVGTGGNGVYKWPMTQHSNITTPFGKTVSSGGKTHTHAGIDIANPIGTPVYASRAGTVTIANNTYDPGGYGSLVVISHRPYGLDNQMGPVAASEETWYGHLSKIGATKGLPVQQGDLIGLCGQSGDATGPHLHFEIRRSKSGSKTAIPVDPIPYLNDTQDYDPYLR